ncbi:MAG: hypothetical protein FWD82_01080 [Defluviitaleaceae bacterium]|nr:hypothetical protein [Defluviitaleaceae bacterium]
MIAIIPAKNNSERIENKNFKPFFNGKSLCDIQIEKLLNIFNPSKIYLSSEDETKKKTADYYGINFIKRDIGLTYNSTPIIDVIKGIYKQISIEDDVMWCQVTDPLFNDYTECINMWEKLDKNEYDSIVAVYRTKQFLLDDKCKPVNFQFGAWHRISQELPPMYLLNFTMSILSHKAISDIGYYVGQKPYWYEINGEYVDIDIAKDWELAQIIYKYFNKG